MSCERCGVDLLDVTTWADLAKGKRRHLLGLEPCRDPGPQCPQMRACCPFCHTALVDDCCPEPECFYWTHPAPIPEYR